MADDIPIPNKPEIPQPLPGNEKGYVDRSELGLPSKIILGSVGIIILFVIWKPKIIEYLSDGAYARAMITLVICLTTVALALLLTYQGALSDVKDEQFRRGREIFTGLMGILGTIVGFYFGSAPATAKPEIAKLEIAEIKLADRKISTSITGGTKPYNYVITVDGAIAIQAESPDGSVAFTLATDAKPSKSIKVDVTDSKEKTASRDLKIGSEPGTSPASKPPSNPGTSQ